MNGTVDVNGQHLAVIKKLIEKLAELLTKR